MLVEDPGWHNFSVGGVMVGDTRWEDYLGDEINISRIGLADDRSHPNVLSMDKINAFNSLAASDPGNISKKIGLNGAIENVRVDYGVNVSVIENNTLANTGGIQLVTVPWPDPGVSNVELIERNVMIDTGKQLFVDCGNAHDSCVLNVSLVNLATRADNITIRLCNFSNTVPINIDPNTGPKYAVDIGTSLTNFNFLMQGEYCIRKNGIDVVNDTVSNVFNFSQGDIIEITIYGTTLSNNYGATSIFVNEAQGASANAFPGGVVDYANDPVYKLRNVYYPGTMRLEVWSSEFG